MDQKPSKDLAPRELLGDVYTAQNEMEPWHRPEEQGCVDYGKKEATASSLCDLKGQNK